MNHVRRQLLLGQRAPHRPRQGLLDKVKEFFDG
jgi:hypothetical protein